MLPPFHAVKWLALCKSSLVLCVALLPLAFAQTAVSEPSPVAPVISASAKAILEATAVLNKKPPGFLAGAQELADFWSARLKAALLLSDGDAAVAALAKIVDAEKDPSKRIKIYEDAEGTFRKNGKTNQVLKVQDALISDENLMPGRRALVAAKLTRSWILSGDSIRANHILDRAKRLAKTVSPAELATLDESIPLAIATEEVILLSRTGESRKAATQSDALSAIYWSQYDQARTPDARKIAMGNLARYQWEHVQYLVNANHVNQALVSAREVLAETGKAKVNAYSEATILAAMSQALAASGAYDLALTQAEQAVAVCVAAKELVTGNNCNLARLLRAKIMLVLGREKEITPDLQWIAEGRSRSQVIAGNFNQKDLDILEAAAGGNWDKALEVATEQYQFAVQRWGTDHSRTKGWASEVFLIKLRNPGYAISLSDAQKFMSSYLASEANDGDSGQRGVEFDRGAIEELLLHIIKHNGTIGTEDARELAYAVVEYLRAGVSQSALYEGAAKMAASDPGLRALIEKEQSLRVVQSDKRSAVLKQASLAEQAAKQNPDEVTLQKQQDALKGAQNALAADETQLKQLRAEISRRYPVYQELTNPHIPSVKELASKLAPDEAYLSLYSGRAAGAAVVILPSGRMGFHPVAQTSASTLTAVRAMRKPFDLGLVPETPNSWSGFDAQTAAALYQSWIGIAQPELASVKLIHIAPGAALASVPWAATLMNSPKEMASARWLGAEKTLVVTPGASSLILGRSLASKVAPDPFIAFANPQFSKSAVTVAGRARRNLLVKAVPDALLESSSAADSFDYSNVPALPETLDEAIAAARSAGADPDKSVIAGAAATRTRVLAEKLDTTRFIEFATHGVQAGELPRLTKPALAMAYEGRGMADSLLTSDDVIGLRLNADWVLLSACNTGLVESGSGDTISGMARAFFAAGAKSILATQWAVESESAKQLVINTLSQYAADPSTGKAQAIAIAQREMASGKMGALYRHPYFWAAYFIMGEPNGKM